MSSKEWVIGGILIIATLIGSMLAPIVNESQVFKTHPEFEAIYTPDIKNTTQIESISITNIGKIQAKNAEFVIQSNDKIFLKKIECPESIPVNFRESEIFTLEFPRFSTNIYCNVDFESSIEGNIYSIVVSSDDAPGYRYEFKKDDTKNEFLVMLKSLYWQFGLIIVASITYGVMATSITYLVFRRRKLNQQRKSAKMRLDEIQNNIENLKSERNILEESSMGAKLSEMPRHWVDRLEWIENELNKLTSEKDRLTGIMSSNIDLHSMIGKFFTNWAILEQQLYMLISKKENKELRTHSIRDMLTILYQQEIMTKNQIDDFERVRLFRNELVHGITRPSKKELNFMNNKLEELLAVINDYNKKNSQTR